MEIERDSRQVSDKQNAKGGTGEAEDMYEKLDKRTNACGRAANATYDRIGRAVTKGDRSRPDRPTVRCSRR